MGENATPVVRFFVMHLYAYDSGILFESAGKTPIYCLASHIRSFSQSFPTSNYPSRNLSQCGYRKMKNCNRLFFIWEILQVRGGGSDKRKVSFAFRAGGGHLIRFANLVYFVLLYQ